MLQMCCYVFSDFCTVCTSLIQKRPITQNSASSYTQSIQDYSVNTSWTLRVNLREDCLFCFYLKMQTDRWTNMEWDCVFLLLCHRVLIQVFPGLTMLDEIIFLLPCVLRCVTLRHMPLHIHRCGDTAVSCLSSLACHVSFVYISVAFR